MQKKIYSTLFLLLVITVLGFSQPSIPSKPAQFTGEVDPSGSVQLQGSYLINYLREFYYYTNSAGKSYDNSRQYLYSKVDITGDQVYCLYTGFTATYDSTDTNTTPSTQVYQNGVGINAEHLWPQSRFSEAGPMVFDLHHLYAAKVQANGDRSNYPFMNIDEADVTYWYLGSDRLTSAPATQDQYLYSKFKSGTGAGFEPRNSIKGDVARAIFYFYAMYSDNAEMLAVIDNPAFFNGMKSTLYGWHQLDTVSTQEQERNAKVETWQGNRNPFADDSSLVYRAFFSDDALSVTYSGSQSGWRMAALPFGKSYATVYQSIWTQGFTGSNQSEANESIYEWNTSTGSFQSISNGSQTASNHNGHIIYFFEDDEPETAGIQGGFPKTKNVTSFTSPTSATYYLHSPDLNTNSSNDANEGWNLLQNPFDRPISVSSLISELESASSLSLNQNVYIWSADNNSYSTLAANGNHTIAPMQAFWIKVDQIVASPTQATVQRAAIQSTTKTSLLKSEFFADLTIKAVTPQSVSTSQIHFSSNSDWNYDSYDAFYLEPINASTAHLYTTDEAGIAYQKQTVPDFLSESEYQIPVYLSDFSGFIELSGNHLNLLDFDIFLDYLGNRIPISEQITQIPIGVVAGPSQAENSFSPFHVNSVLKKPEILEEKASLVFRKREITSIEKTQQPNAFSISDAFPNPFNPTTQFSIQTEYSGEIQWEVLTVLGQSVQSGSFNVHSGTNTFSLQSAHSWSSGVYLIQFRLPNATLVTKQITLLK